MFNITGLCHLAKYLREDILDKHIDIRVFGLFLHRLTLCLEPFIDGFNNHPVGFGEITFVHDVDFVYDVVKQVSLLIHLTACSTFFTLQCLFLLGGFQLYASTWLNLEDMVLKRQFVFQINLLMGSFWQQSEQELTEDICLE